MTCNDTAQLTQPTYNSHSNSPSNSHNYPLYEGGGSCVSLKCGGSTDTPPAWSEHTLNDRRTLTNRRRRRMAGQRAGFSGGPWPPHGSATHKQARAYYQTRLIIDGPMLCAYLDCITGPGKTRKIIRAGSKWDLAHDDDNPGRYIGPACRRCNRGVKRRHGRKGNRTIQRSTIKRSKAEQRELDRMRSLAKSDTARRQRLILPTQRDRGVTG